MRQKRKPDFRRIGPSRTYSIKEFAEAVQRDVATVRAWIRQGMPTLDDLKPVVIDGAAAKEWLKQKWLKRKKPTKPGEARCFHCKTSRPFASGSGSVSAINHHVLMLSGKCAVCGGKMSQMASAKSVEVFNLQDKCKRSDNAA